MATMDLSATDIDYDHGASKTTELHILTPTVTDPAASDDNSPSLAWDSTFHHDTSLQLCQSTNARTLCTHAFAIQSNVIHYTQQWTMNLQAAVVFVASNSDGSVIVAAVDTGSIVLLRGRDGAVLASHKMNGNTNDNDNNMTSLWSFSEMGPPSISWILGSKEQDAFWIEGPVDETSEDGNCLLYTLVSNIHGELLNSDNPATVTQATRNMQLSTISLPASTWRASVGYFAEHSYSTNADGSTTSSPRVIRIVACVNDGCLAVYDYDLSKQSTKEVRKGIILQQQPQQTKHQSAGDEDWCVDYELGLRIHEFRDKFYVLVVGFTSSQASLYWFDPVALNAACAYAEEIPDELATGNGLGRKQTTSMVRPKILSMEPLV
jgi:hypothetical protein